jgi:alanyl-tRNA synthetase
MGALCPFGEKYGDMVRVLEIPGISMEFCGGTHVNDIAEIGMVHILSETSIAAGVRRIEGTVSRPAFLCLQSSARELEKIRRSLSIKEGACERVSDLQENLKKQEKEIRFLRQQLLQYEADKFLANHFQHGDFNCISGIFNDADGGAFREVTDNCAKKMGSGVLIFANRGAEKVSFICRVSPDLVSRGLDAAKILGPVAEISGGRGGGRGPVAQAGGNQPDKAEAALALLPKILSEFTHGLSAHVDDCC